MDKKLRVWWVPQLPMMEQFTVEVDSVAEGVKLMKVLADYDLFQFENNIKPDYCNTGGMEELQHEMGAEWEGWYDEDTGIDDPIEYLEYLASAA